MPGTDGEKMSKSSGNVIEIFEAPKKLRKKRVLIPDGKGDEICIVFRGADEVDVVWYREGQKIPS